MSPTGSSERRLSNQSTEVSVANSTIRSFAKVRPGNQLRP